MIAEMQQLLMTMMTTMMCRRVHAPSIARTEIQNKFGSEKLQGEGGENLLKVDAAAAVAVNDAHHLLNDSAGRGKSLIDERMRCVMCDV